MANDQFKGTPAIWPGTRTPWRGENFTPPLPGRPITRNQLDTETAGSVAIPNDGIQAVREDYRFAYVNSLGTIAPFIANVGAAAPYLLILQQPHSKRNLLSFRHAGTLGFIYIDFGQPPNVNSSVYVLTAGQILQFDTVVPQDDVYVASDQVAGLPLAYAYSNYRAE